MNNKTEKQYIINGTDYIRHIDEKIELYEMLKELVAGVKKLPVSPYVRILTDKAKRYESEADSLFNDWGIPNTYLTDGDIDDLGKLMSNELTEFDDYDEYYDCDYEDEYDENNELFDIAHELNDICGRLSKYAEKSVDADD